MKVENVYIVHTPNHSTEMKKNNISSAEQKLREVETKLVDIVTSFGYLKGRSSKSAKVTAHMSIRREITQKLLRELTGYSLGTISNTLQSLEKMGMVSKHQDPESREYHYEIDENFAQTGSRSMNNIFEYFSQLKEFLQEIKTELGQPHLSDKRGFKNIHQFVTKMDNLFPAIEQVMLKISILTADVKDGSGLDR